MHFLNLKEQQYLLDIKRDVKYNVNAEFVKDCINSYIASLNNNYRPAIARERNMLIDDTNIAVRAQDDENALLGVNSMSI
jgi:hypothetical protein